MSENGYNGWANYETWNVALWIDNDQGLYLLARECEDYKTFVEQLNDGNGKITYQTPDGVAWNDSGINVDEVNEACFSTDENEE